MSASVCCVLKLGTTEMGGFWLLLDLVTEREEFQWQRDEKCLVFVCARDCVLFFSVFGILRLSFWS